MAQNVEIKAYARHFQEQTKRAAQCSDQEVRIIHQEDIFYKSDQGRLKLRMFPDQQAELIAYDRPDQQGPKTSDYSIAQCTWDMKTVLDRALETIGVVKKKRTLYMVDRTRIHLDEVEGLGCFLELEVVLRPGETSEQGQGIAHALMQELNISKEDLIDKAYIDLLLEQKQA